MSGGVKQLLSLTWVVPFAAAERFVELIDRRPRTTVNGDTVDDVSSSSVDLHSLVDGTFQAADRMGRRVVDSAAGLVAEETCRGGASGEVSATSTTAQKGSMPAEFKAFVRTRGETLEIVERLSQEEIDHAPASGGWSLGEVLDHLIRVDSLFRRDIDRLVARKIETRPPFLFRGLAESQFSLPGMPDALLPWLDPPVALLGIAIPRSLRQIVARNRRVPARAPKIILPIKGRAADALRDELRQMIDYLDALVSDNPDLDFDGLFYYNPLTGFATVPGVISFASSHESRHQEQLREIVAGLGQPKKE